ncbi:hypothetical protein ACJX0J_032840 [Zea mays]
MSFIVPFDYLIREKKVQFPFLDVATRPVLWKALFYPFFYFYMWIGVNTRVPKQILKCNQFTAISTLLVKRIYNYHHFCYLLGFLKHILHHLTIIFPSISIHLFYLVFRGHDLNNSSDNDEISEPDIWLES